MKTNKFKLSKFINNFTGIIFKYVSDLISYEIKFRNVGQTNRRRNVVRVWHQSKCADSIQT